MPRDASKGDPRAPAAESASVPDETETGGERCFVVSHRSVYRFERELNGLSAVAFLLPREVPGQRCDRAQVTSIPSLRGREEGLDDKGNRRSAFTVPGPLWQCRISLNARFFVDAPKTADAGASAPWDLSADSSPDVGRFLEASDLTPQSPEIRDYVRSDFGAGRPRLDAAMALAKRLAADIRFDMNATTPETSAAEAFALRAGVCVDYVQIALSGLRALGVPCRYVYGYRFGGHPPGRAADLPHAWMSIHDPCLGWIDIDPTTGLLCDQRYMTVAWGRDFAEVPPLALESENETAHRLKVQVDISERS